MWRKLAIIDLLMLVYIFYFVSQLGMQFPTNFSLQNFPLLQQPDGITCGPTSAAMLLTYYGKPTSIEEVRYKAKTTWFTYKGRNVGMTIPKRLQTGLHESGLDTTLKQSNLRELKYYISKSQPPILLLRSGEKTWHYVVAIGYNESSIIVADPADASERTITNEDLIGAWDFSQDTQGHHYGNDFYRFIVMMAEVQGKTCLIPKFPAIPIPLSPTKP